MILGDWNYPEINWLQTCDTANYRMKRFLNACSAASLTQLVNEPTRISNTGSSNVVDLVLTNSEDIIQSIAIDPSIGKGDHASRMINRKWLFLHDTVK